MLRAMTILLAISLSAAVSPGGSYASEGHAPGQGGHASKPKAVEHKGEGILKSTGKGLFGVTLLVEGNKLEEGMNRLDLEIRDGQGREVSGAEVSVTPWMTDMGHGSGTEPLVTEKAGGLYGVDRVSIIMKGNWEIRVAVKAGGRSDTVVFGFPGMKAPGEESYIKAMSPAGYEVVLGRENPLPELEPEVVNDGGTTVKVFKLSVENVNIELYPGKFVAGWGFGGRVPGPTIRVREGDRVRIVLTNETDEKHTLHVHGQKKPFEMDGVPYLGQRPLEKGESYTYEFTAVNPGTSWYHCHVDTAHHVDMGMYGAFIVEPREEKYPFDKEYIMLLDEWVTAHEHIHPGMEMEEEKEKEHGVVTEHPGRPDVHEEPAKRDWYPETYNEYKPVYDAFLINGKAFPFTEPLTVKAGEKVKIRFINVGAMTHYMHVHSHKFLVTHRDGSPVNDPEKLDTVAVGPGQRVDILLNADNPGIYPFHCHVTTHISNDNIYPGGMLFMLRYLD